MERTNDKAMRSIRSRSPFLGKRARVRANPGMKRVRANPPIMRMLVMSGTVISIGNI